MCFHSETLRAYLGFSDPRPQLPVVVLRLLQRLLLAPRVDILSLADSLLVGVGIVNVQNRPAKHQGVLSLGGPKQDVIFICYLYGVTRHLYKTRQG